MRINYDIPDLRAFCSLVRSGQYSIAATQLCITTSALSRRIAKLETEIGGRLFERTTRRVSVTTLGRSLYEQIQPVLGQLDSHILDAARAAVGHGGRLAVGTVASVGCTIFPRILPAFYARHPQSYLAIRDANATVVTKMVEDGEVEFGVTTSVAFPPSLEVVQLAGYGFNLIYSSTSAISSMTSELHWSQLLSLPVVGLHPLSSTRLQIDEVLHSRGIPTPWKLEVDQLATMIGLVQSGSFCAVMPALFDASKYDLRATKIGEPDIQRGIHIVRRQNARLTPQAQFLLELVQDQF